MSHKSLHGSSGHGCAVSTDAAAHSEPLSCVARFRRASHSHRTQHVCTSVVQCIRMSSVCNHRLPRTRCHIPIYLAKTVFVSVHRIRAQRMVCRPGLVVTTFRLHRKGAGIDTRGLYYMRSRNLLFRSEVSSQFFLCKH